MLKAREIECISLLTEETDAQEVINRLTKIFGIKSISPVHKTSQELDEIKNYVLI